MEKAWTELHVGSDITIPRIYRFIIKFITPAFLLFILGFWFVQEWIPTILLRNVPHENFWFIVGIRLMLLVFFMLLVFLVWMAWKRRRKEGSCMTLAGWIFFVVSWLVILLLFLFSLIRTLRTKSRNNAGSPDA